LTILAAEIVRAWIVVVTLHCCSRAGSFCAGVCCGAGVLIVTRQAVVGVFAITCLTPVISAQVLVVTCDGASCASSIHADVVFSARVSIVTWEVVVGVLTHGVFTFICGAGVLVITLAIGVTGGLGLASQVCVTYLVGIAEVVIGCVGALVSCKIA